MCYKTESSVNIQEILNCKCKLNGKETTIKGYLKTLLRELWGEGESFSAKRPFGNSGWEYDIYSALLKAGLIDGVIDDDGYVDEIDERQAKIFIFYAIDSL